MLPHFNSFCVYMSNSASVTKFDFHELQQVISRSTVYFKGKDNKRKIRRGDNIKPALHAVQLVYSGKKTSKSVKQVRIS